MTVTGPERLADLVRASPGRLVLPDRPRGADVAVPTPLRLLDAPGLGDGLAVAVVADASGGRWTVPLVLDGGLRRAPFRHGVWELLNLGDTVTASIGYPRVAGPGLGLKSWRLTVTVMDPLTAAQPPAADALYDGRRDAYYTKPVLRGWLHLLWFEASLVFGTLLLTRVHGASRIIASAIYVASVSGLFGISALYHRGNWSAAWRRRLQRLDHAMIFFLIAGTATPAFLLAAPGTFGLVCLIVMWTLTLTAATLRMVWMSLPERLAGAVFLGLGWVAGLALPEVWAHTGVAAAMLMIAGGVLYTAGALSYHRRSPDPSPSVFGYHEVFHAFVCAAATCQYVAIAMFIA